MRQITSCDTEQQGAQCFATEAESICSSPSACSMPALGTPRCASAHNAGPRSVGRLADDRCGLGKSCARGGGRSGKRDNAADIKLHMGKSASELEAALRTERPEGRAGSPRLCPARPRRRISRHAAQPWMRIGRGAYDCRAQDGRGVHCPDGVWRARPQHKRQSADGTCKHQDKNRAANNAG